MRRYTSNHYVPQWLQYRFFPACQKDKRFFYLDLHPEKFVSQGHKYTRRDLMRWGPRNCFCIDDLYTTALGDWKSTEIEEKFFGPIDKNGRSSIKYFSDFEHPSANQRMFSDLLRYMSTQKLRTPKGLANVAFIAGTSDKNATLFTVQRLRDMFCAIWTECVWSIVDASESKTKFLLSDHPITVYNKACFPGSKHCRGHNDPAIWLTGLHRYFQSDDAGRSSVLSVDGRLWRLMAAGSTIWSRDGIRRGHRRRSVDACRWRFRWGP